MRFLAHDKSLITFEDHESGLGMTVRGGGSEARHDGTWGWQRNKMNSRIISLINVTSTFPRINVIPAYRQAGRAELIVLRDEKVSEGSREFRSLRIHSAVLK